VTKTPPAPVETGSEGRNCQNCGNPLPPKDPRAREHRFCPGSKCRSAWHGKEKRRALNEALRLVVKMRAAGFYGVDEDLALAERELRTAGAE
jgi:hypothetical protein